MSQVLPSIKRHEIEAPIWRLVLCVCITHYLDEDKQDTGVTKRRRGAKKKGSQKAEVVWERKQGSQSVKVKILAVGKILEMGEDPGDDGGGWKQMLGHTQGH